PIAPAQAPVTRRTSRASRSKIFFSGAEEHTPRQWTGSVLLHSRPIARTSAVDPTAVGQFLASGKYRKFVVFFRQQVVKRDPGLVAIVVHLLANIGNSTIQLAIV